ncbi:hypothetical protein Tco_0237096 [Tanacetum coccineum]
MYSVQLGILRFVIPADSSSSIPADNVPAGSSSSIPADYVSAGHTQPTQTNQTSQQYPNNVQSQQFQQFQTASISANNAKFPYLEKDKYEIWAMKNGVLDTESDHKSLEELFTRNSLKEVGKDAKEIQLLYLKIICPIFITMMMQGIFGWQLRLVGGMKNQRNEETISNSSLPNSSVTIDKKAYTRIMDSFFKILEPVESMQQEPTQLLTST